MEKMNWIGLGLFVLPLFFSCSSERRERLNEAKIVVSEDTTSVEKALYFYNYEEINAFPDAIIEMYSPLGNQRFEVGKVPFEFNIKNYPFGEGLQGFRLKLVINGNSPIGFNLPIFKMDFKEGSYRAVAYLIDDNGIALKDFGNFVERDFTVGDSRPIPDSEEPYMVLNLPEEGQIFSLGSPVIVDYLLIGADLKEDKLKFLIELNGSSYDSRTTFPVRIDNLGPGEHALKIQLMKEDGTGFSGIFSEVNRTFLVRE